MTVYCFIGALVLAGNLSISRGIYLGSSTVPRIFELEWHTVIAFYLHNCMQESGICSDTLYIGYPASLGRVICDHSSKFPCDYLLPTTEEPWRRNITFVDVLATQ